MNQLHIRISNRWISTNLELDVRMEVIVQIPMHPKVHVYADKAIDFDFRSVSWNVYFSAQC